MSKKANQKEFNKVMNNYLSDRNETKATSNVLKWVSPKKNLPSEEKLNDDLINGEIDSTKIHIIEKDTPWYERLFDGLFSRKNEEDAIEEIESDIEAVEVDPNTGNSIREEEEESFEEELADEEQVVSQTSIFHRLLNKLNPFSVSQQIHEYDVEVEPEEKEEDAKERIERLIADINIIKDEFLHSEKTKSNLLTDKIQKLEEEMRSMVVEGGSGAKVRKLVLYKPQVDQDIIEFMGITENLIKQLPNHVLRSFEKSSDYDKYSSILSKYRK